MKKFIAILMILTMLVPMGACGAKKEPAPAPAPTQTNAPAPVPAPTPTLTPAPTEPPYELGIARARYGEIIYTTMDLYSEVTVIGQFDDYYVIEGEEVDLIIDKRVIRLDREEPFTPWDGYAQSGAKVYETAYMDGEVIAELDLNTQVKVLDGKEDWLRIEWAEGNGYAHIDDISETMIVANRGGGNGGAQDGTDVSMGDLALVLEKKPDIVPLASCISQEIEPIANAPALTLTHETRAYLFLTERDDELKVTKVDEETCEIYTNGFYATAPRWLFRMDGDEAYEPWTGFAKGGEMFGEYQMRNVLAELNTNDQVLVIDELPTCYVVEFDGQIGYVLLDDISETQIVARRGGGGGDWTPPAL